MAAKSQTPAPTSAPTTAHTPQHKRRWDKATTRLYSGVLLALVLGYIGAGILWALLRPTYTATPVGDGRFELGEETNVEYVGFLWFLALSSVVAVVVSAWLVSHHERRLHAGLYAWVSGWTVLCQFVMIGTSDLMVRLVHPVHEDAVIAYAPAVPVGALGYVLAPCLAALILWVGMLYSDPPVQQDALTDSVEPAA